jgi:hypothetical protein
MVNKRNSSEKPPQGAVKDNTEWGRVFSKQLFTTLCIILALLAVPAGYIVYVSIPDKIKAEMGEQFKGPLQTLVKHEIEPTANQGKLLSEQQGKMQYQLTELTVKFDLYFDKQLNKKVAENTVQRAVEAVGSSQDKTQRIVALKVASHVLERAAANHVPIDHKKANASGLALLEQQYADDEKPALRETLSELARQRTLKFPAPQVPKENSKYIVGGDQRLDGPHFQDVTFVNCKILYSDGFLDLQNVRFINCTFDVFPENTGKEFYTALFSSNEPIPTVTVKTPGSRPIKKES